MKSRALSALIAGVLLAAPAPATQGSRHEDSPGRPKVIPGRPAIEAWAPPDLDEHVFTVDASAACPLPEVLNATATRVTELVSNLEKFAATERIEYAEVTKKGKTVQRKARAFDYIVSLKEIRPRMLSVDEYRNGDSGSQIFFQNLATNGVPALVLIFHPYYLGDFEMKCEGLGEVSGEPAWQVYFRQRADRPSRISSLRVGFESYKIDLKGRAWLSLQTGQILKLETDALNPPKRCGLKRSHKVVEYQKVRFEKANIELWLPARAQVFLNLNGHRYQVQHSFSNYQLFNVSARHTILAPPDPE